MHSNVRCSIKLNADQWRKGEGRCGTYIQGNISHKNTKTLSFAEMWIDLETIIQSEVRKANIVYYLLYVESRKMLEMNPCRKETQMERTNTDTKE